MTEELKPCPFCGEVPNLPSGDGTQYEIECGNCAMAMASVQICDLMTGEERSAEKFTNDRYSEQYVERAKAEAIKQWNTRATLSPAHIEDGEEISVVRVPSCENSYGFGYVDGSCHVDLRKYRNHLEDILDALPNDEPLMTVAQHQRIVDARASKAAPRVEDERERSRAVQAAFNDWAWNKKGEAVGRMDGQSAAIAGFHAGAEWQARAALSAPPAAGVPIGMACKINGYWEAQLFAGHGCIDRQSLYAHPLPPADVPTGLAHRLLKAYDHGDTGAIEAAIEDIRTMLAAAPTPPAAGTTSDQYRAELYDEVWQKARDMGYGNVTDALVELERMKATPPAAGVNGGVDPCPGCMPGGVCRTPTCGRLVERSKRKDGVNISDAPSGFKRPATPPPAPPASEQQNLCPHDSWRYGGGPCGDCGEVQFSEEELLRLNRPASEQQRAVVMPEGLREALGKAASSWLYENDPQGLDWCDPRNVDALLDALFEAAPHLAKGEGV